MVPQIVRGARAVMAASSIRPDAGRGFRRQCPADRAGARGSCAGPQRAARRPTAAPGHVQGGREVATVSAAGQIPPRGRPPSVDQNEFVLSICGAPSIGGTALRRDAVSLGCATGDGRKLLERSALWEGAAAWAANRGLAPPSGSRRATAPPGLGYGSRPGRSSAILRRWLRRVQWLPERAVAGLR